MKNIQAFHTLLAKADTLTVSNICDSVTMADHSVDAQMLDTLRSLATKLAEAVEIAGRNCGNCVFNPQQLCLRYNTYFKGNNPPCDKYQRSYD
jgi:hypothetical protein